MPEPTILLEVVTPQKVVFKGDVVSFTAPGVLGGFQVLYNHAPLLSEIGVGQVKFTTADAREHYYAVSGGFVEVKENHIVLLAETAERVDQIDVQRAEAAKERAAKRLRERRPDVDLERARAALLRATNRLKVAQRM